MGSFTTSTGSLLWPSVSHSSSSWLGWTAPLCPALMASAPLSQHSSITYSCAPSPGSSSRESTSTCSLSRCSSTSALCGPTILWAGEYHWLWSPLRWAYASVTTALRISEYLTQHTILSCILLCLVCKLSQWAVLLLALVICSCWITTGNGTNWAFHGPVIAVLLVSI